MREVTRTLEEQTMKRKINRRSDLLPVTLVMDNNQVRGIIALDIESGDLIPIQAKSVIVASQGYQGIWSAPSHGAGNGLAISHVPNKARRNVLGPDARSDNCRYWNSPADGYSGIRRENLKRLREDAGPLEVMDGESCVLDMRFMEKSSEGWFKDYREGPQ